MHSSTFLRQAGRHGVGISFLRQAGRQGIHLWEPLLHGRLSVILVVIFFVLATFDKN